MKKYVKNIICFIGVILSLFYYLNNEYSQIGNTILATYLFCISLVMCFYIKESFELWLLGIFITYFYYGMIANDYLPNGCRVPFAYYKNVEYYGKGIALLLLFSSVFFICISCKYVKTQFSLRNYQRKNTLIVWGLIFAQIFIIIYGFDRTVSSSYKVHISTIYEYIYIFILVSLMFAKDQKIAEIVILCCSGFAIIQDLYFGGRITSLQIIIVLIVFYQEKVKRLTWLIGMFGGVIVFSLVGIYRKAYMLTGDFVQNFLDSFFRNRFTLDTTYFAWYATITDLIAKDVYSNETKISNFIGFVLNIIGIHAEDYEMVPVLAYKAGYVNVGGSYAFAFFYFWFGIVGVIVGALLFGVIIMKIIRSKGALGKILLCVVVASSPRWILYTPINFFRAPLLCCILYGMCNVFDGVINKRKIVLKM